MSKKDDSKITWIICPECGAKIGVAISVGKTISTTAVPKEPSATWPPTSVVERLATAGVDLSLLDVEEGEEVITVSLKSSSATYGDL